MIAVLGIQFAVLGALDIGIKAAITLVLYVIKGRLHILRG
ncbi:hypothetical protein SAMN02910398_02271 [Butyrivibrio sp. YAB3001]|nr:hypothetical protein SAMN02910398_02271 [Butyrivibrio sp. YAB3001]